MTGEPPTFKTQGRLITLEGGEGSGKSTQARRLARHLEKRGRQAVLTREPGGSPLAERLRDIILERPPASPATEFLLFAAARAEHIATLISPALAAGKVVVCDRYIDSTRVYQGLLAGIPADLIASIETHTVAPVLPDLTFVLDIHPRVGLERARLRGELSRYDAADDAYHEGIRNGFLDIAAREPDRCVVIDGDEREDEIASTIASVVDRRLFGAV